MPMNYRDPDGWLLPSRNPQHAAAFCFPNPARRHARRALRLIVVAGPWAAGLCLVIGSIVLVATAAAPNRALPHLTAAAQRTALAAATQQRRSHGTGPVGRPGPARSDSAAQRASAGRQGEPAGSASSYQVLAAFTGQEDVMTRHFTVRTGVPWELQWSYACPAGLPAGQLIVEDAGGAAAGQTAAGASIDEIGIGGDGATWLNPNGTRHYLVVISTCSWTIKVVQSR
jgi:hypothetical protein